MHQTQTKYDSLLASIRVDQQKIGTLEEAATNREGDKKVMEERLSGISSELKQALEVNKKVEAEKEQLIKDKTVMEGEMMVLRTQLDAKRAELEAVSTRERDLVKELEHLMEVWGWMWVCGLGAV